MVDGQGGNHFTTGKKVQFGPVLVPGAYEACATKKVFPVQWCLMVTDGVRTEAMTSEQCPMNQRMTNGGLRPAILLQPLQTLAILEVRGATNPLQGATTRYSLRHL